MSPEIHILAWWLAFGGTHLIGSSLAVRPRLIDRLGLRGFKGLYSLVAFATFIPLCWVYANHKHVGEQLFIATPELRWAAHVLMLVGLPLLALALTADNPLTTQAEMAGHFTPEPTGVLRVTRHPMNTAFALFGFAHLLTNPFVGDWIFWGGLVVYSVVSAFHQDARSTATGPDAVRRFHEITSAIPFGAILRGRQKLRTSELRPVPILVGLGLFALLRTYHAAWFGGFGG